MAIENAKRSDLWAAWHGDSRDQENWVLALGAGTSGPADPAASASADAGSDAPRPDISGITLPPGGHASARHGAQHGTHHAALAGPAACPGAAGPARETPERAAHAGAAQGHGLAADFAGPASDAAAVSPKLQFLVSRPGLSGPAPITPDMPQDGPGIILSPAAQASRSASGTLAPPIGAQTILFSESAQSITGGSDSFSFGLPSFLYHSYSFSRSASAGPFSLYGSVGVTAGISGGATLTLGDFTPNFAARINPGVLANVIDGTQFAVDPSLIAANGAFGIDLASAAASLSIGATASALAGLAIASEGIGFNTPFGYVGVRTPSISLPLSVGFGNFYHLPASGSISIPGGYLELSQIAAASAASGTVSAAGSLPSSVGYSGQTAPFISGSVDIVALLAHYIPELAAVSGSYSALDGLVSASYDLFSLPLTVSLALGESVTLTPTGITETVTDPLNQESHSGSLGSIFLFDAPSSGAGTIPLSITYTLGLEINSSIGLDGSISLALDGPQASLSVLDIGGSLGPVFSQTLFDYSGQIAQLASWAFSQSLIGSTTVDVNYLASSAAVTISTAKGAQTLTSAGPVLDILSAGKVTGTATAIQSGTLSSAQITNAGSVLGGTNGIILLTGGVVDNLAGGVIEGNRTIGQGYSIAFRNNIADVFSNAGELTDFTQGVYLAGGTVTNLAGGQIFGENQAIVIGAGNAFVSNASNIAGGLGVSLHNGGVVQNLAGAEIDGDNSDGVSASGQTLTLNNAGSISGLKIGIGASGGAIITNQHGAAIYAVHGNGIVLSGAGGVILNQGTITGRYGDGASLTGNAVTLENAGTIVGAVDAVYLGAGSNTLQIDPGAVFKGAVVVKQGAAATLALGAGSITSTLTGLGSTYAGFGTVNFTTGSAWDVAASQSVMTATVFDNVTTSDTLDLTDLAYAAGEVARVNAQTGQLSIYGNPNGYEIPTGPTLQIGGALRAHQFIVSDDGHGGTDLRMASAPSGTLIGSDAGIKVAPGSYYGATLTVASGASLYAGSSTAYGVHNAEYGLKITGEAGRIVNNGFVTGRGQGILLAAGGTVINGAPSETGTVPFIFSAEQTLQGTLDQAVAITGGAGTLLNYVNISGGYRGTAVYFGAGGSITNSYGGNISGDTGIVVAGAAGTILNQGSITSSGVAGNSGSAGVAILLEKGGNVINTGNAFIGITGAVVIEGAAGNVINTGIIDGGAYGVSLAAGGLVDNAYGTISGMRYGAAIAGGGTILNADAITGVSLKGGGTIVNSIYATISSTSSMPGFTAIYSASGNGASTFIHNNEHGIIAGIRAYGNATILNDYTGLISNGVIMGGHASYASAATLTNYGTINLAAAQIYARAVGTGVSIQGDAAVTNAAGGVISGGSVYGIGLDVQGATNVTVVNYGDIQGGAEGVDLTGANITLLNGGTISGTMAPPGGLSGTVLDGSLTNTLIIEANAVFTGPITVNGNAQNTLVLGGAGGAGTLQGLGSIFPNFGTLDVAAGANWVVASGTDFTGDVVAAGGISLLAGGSFTGTADGAVSVTATGTLSNAGTVLGSAGTYDFTSSNETSGGTGLVQSGGKAVNTGLIAGGAGPDLPYFNNGVALPGGAGVILSGGVLTNAGTITGGSGKYGYHLAGYGGAGVVITGGTLINNGHITGGNGGNFYSAYFQPSGGGAGGAGIYLDGGTLINNGTITGGAGGANLSVNPNMGNGAAGSAVQFGGTSATLELEAHAHFGSAVVANAGAHDVLALGGTKAGVLSGLGTAFVDFAELTVLHGATWKISGASTFTGAVNIAGSLAVCGIAGWNGAVYGGGALTILGALTDNATISVAVTDDGTLTANGGTLALTHKLAGTGTLLADAGSTIRLSTGGTLANAVSGAGTLELAGGFTLGTAALGVKHVQIDAGATLGGAGMLACAITDSGTLTARGGTLTLAGTLTGGTATAAAGAALVLAGGGTLSSLLGGAGAITIASATTLASGATFAGADIVAQAALHLATGAQLAETAGATLNLQAASGQTLTVSGTNATLSNAGVLQARSGSAQIAVGIVNTGQIKANGGALAFLGTVTNSGTITAQAGTLSSARQITGTGTLAIGAAGTLVLQAGAGSGQSVNFLSGTGALDLATPQGFGAAIAGFSANDLIDLQNLTASSLEFAGGTLTLLNGGTAEASLKFLGAYTATEFSLASDGTGGTLIKFV